MVTFNVSHKVITAKIPLSCVYCKNSPFVDRYNKTTLCSWMQVVQVGVLHQARIARYFMATVVHQHSGGLSLMVLLLCEQWATPAFCTFTTQRSGVRWWLPDECYTGTFLYSGEDERNSWSGVQLQYKGKCRMKKKNFPFLLRNCLVFMSIKK